MRIRSYTTESDFVEVGATMEASYPIRVRVGQNNTSRAHEVSISGAIELRKALSRCIKDARRKAAKK